MTFKFKRKPRRHQAEALRLWGGRDAFALLMEQGTGKTKVVIDFACQRYAEGAIDALLVLAPTDVAMGWVIDALPKDMSPQVPYVSAWYESNPLVSHRKVMDRVWDRDFVGLRVITMHYEALSGSKGQQYLATFLNTFRTLLAADESSAIKNITAKRSEFAVDISDRAPYRVILNGTPITRGPFDAYAQFRFLDTEILPFESYFAFKAHFCEMEDPKTSFLLRHIVQRANQNRGKGSESGKRKLSIHQLQMPVRVDGKVQYRNLTELQKLIAPYSYRVLKVDCLDLPPKEYSKRYIQLTPEQRKLYDSVRDNLITELDLGSISPAMKMTRMLRLQQILGGYVMFDGDTELTPLFASLKDNPRLESVGNVFEQCSGKLIVWSRFVREVDDIDAYLTERFKDKGFHGVKHYGPENDPKVREDNKKRYINDPDCRWFVGTQKAGARGLDGLQAVTSAVYYYSNSFSLDDRLQSEDRAHRDGTTGTVSIYDAIARGTLDDRLVDDLRNKKDVADIITGDPKLDWI